MEKEEIEDDSVRGMLEAAWKENVSDDETPAESPSEEPKVTEEGAKPAPVEATEATPEDAEKDPSEPLNPPNRWTKTQKEWFAKLDPKFQGQLIEHDKNIQADYTRKTQEMSLARQRYGGIEEQLAPRRDEWQRLGWSDEQALGNVLQYWDFASSDPMNFIAHFASERGIDLAQAFAPSMQEILQHLEQGDLAGAEGQGGSQVPPEMQGQLQQLAHQNQMLQQQIAQHQGYFTQQQQAMAQSQQETASQEVARFAQQVDEHGNIMFEFLDELRDDMSRLLRADVAEDLEDAYDMALYRRPDLVDRIEETQAVTQRAAEERRQQEEAERARRASLSLGGSSSVAGAAPDDDERNLSVRDIIQREWAKQQQGGRV